LEAAPQLPPSLPQTKTLETPTTPVSQKAFETSTTPVSSKTLDKSNGNPNACPGCGNEFNFKYELNKHTVTCQPAILIQEKEKLETQLEQERLKREEQERKKAERKYLCEHCQERFGFKFELKQHVCPNKKKTLPGKIAPPVPRPMDATARGSPPQKVASQPDPAPPTLPAQPASAPPLPAQTPGPKPPCEHNYTVGTLPGGTSVLFCSKCAHVNTTFTPAPAQPASKPGRGPDKFLKNDTKEKQRRGKEKPAESNVLQFAPKMEIQTEKKTDIKKEPEKKPGEISRYESTDVIERRKELNNTISASPFEPNTEPPPLPSKTGNNFTQKPEPKGIMGVLADNNIALGQSTTSIFADHLGFDPKRKYPVVTMQIVAFKTVTEGAGVACKKYGVYEIQCIQGNSVWTIFRRYQQCFDLDKKLKDHKFLDKHDKTLPPKNLGKRDNGEIAVRERASGLENWFRTALSQEKVRNCPYFYNFVGPFQLGDKRAVSITNV